MKPPIQHSCRVGDQRERQPGLVLGPDEAAAGLIIGHAAFLQRGDFTALHNPGCSCGLKPPA